MSRSKQFSVDSALSKAMLQFWYRGYHPTSIQTLVDCMAIGRGSIYDTFDSKRGLFLKALRHYFNSVHRRLDSLLHHDSSPIDSIMDVFEGVILDAPPRFGCFFVNAAVELAPFDAQAAHLVSTSFHDIEQTFLQLIVQGQAAGQLSPSVDAPLTARCLLSLYISLGVLIRTTSDAALLQMTRRQALALLGCALPRDSHAQT